MGFPLEKVNKDWGRGKGGYEHELPYVDVLCIVLI